LPRASGVKEKVRLYLPFVLTYHRAAWTALGDPTRQAIFERLLEQPTAVGALARELPVSRPAVSQHLKILKTAGLVTVEPRGTRRVYRADPDGIAALRGDLERFWKQALKGFKAIVEQPEAKG
jgi:DNA-binding transcriptional ArsR family regulator